MKYLNHSAAAVFTLLVSACGSHSNSAEPVMIEGQPLSAVDTKVPSPSQLSLGTIDIDSADDLLNIFNDQLVQQAQASDAHIDRLYIEQLPADWVQKSQQWPVKTKKHVFFASLLPLILSNNEAILADRAQLLQSDINDPEQREWLQQLAKKYKLQWPANEESLDVLMQALLQRVDIIPPSLALAQAAEESGWGSSRFCREGNAFFGQWDYSGKGMKPQQHRAHLGNYGVARFDSALGLSAGLYGQP